MTNLHNVSCIISSYLCNKVEVCINGYNNNSNKLFQDVNCFIIIIYYFYKSLRRQYSQVTLMEVLEY